MIIQCVPSMPMHEYLKISCNIEFHCLKLSVFLKCPIVYKCLLIIALVKGHRLTRCTLLMLLCPKFAYA